MTVALPNLLPHHPINAMAAVTQTRMCVLACFTLVGLFDIISALFMALPDGHALKSFGGLSAVFLSTPVASSAHDHISALLLRGSVVRLAAFSWHVGVLTLYLAWRFRHESSVISAIFLIYTVNGLGFAYYDHTFVDQASAYFLVKQAIGAIWAVALVAHFVEVARSGGPRSKLDKTQ